MFVVCVVCAQFVVSVVIRLNLAAFKRRGSLSTLSAVQLSGLFYMIRRKARLKKGLLLHFLTSFLIVVSSLRIIVDIEGMHLKCLLYNPRS